MRWGRAIIQTAAIALIASCVAAFHYGTTEVPPLQWWAKTILGVEPAPIPRPTAGPQGIAREQVAAQMQRAREYDRELASRFPGLASLEVELRFYREENCILSRAEFNPKASQDNPVLSAQVAEMNRSWRALCAVLTRAHDEVAPVIAEVKSSGSLSPLAFSFFVFIEDSEEEVGSFYRAIEVGPFLIAEQCLSLEEEVRRQNIPTRQCGSLSQLARLSEEGAG